MEKIARQLLSMRMMAVAMIVFLVAIGAATLIESQYDIQTAKIMIYNATWFEILLAFLCVNLIANIFRYKMFERDKIAMLMFHLSFIVMIIGAGVTRFISFEGLMLIREGAQTDFIYSSDPHLWIKINDGELQYTNSWKKYMSEQTNNNFTYDIDFPNHATPIKIEYVDFNKKMIDSLVVNDSIQSSSLDIVTGGMNSNFVSEGEFLMLGDVALSFEKKDAMPGIEIFKQGPKVLMKTQLPVRYLPMAEMRKARQSGADVPDSLYTQVPLDTLVPFQTTTLYQVGNEQFVFKGILKNSKRIKMSSGSRKRGSDYLTLKVSDGDHVELVELEGGQGAIPAHVVFSLNGLTYEMEYGSMKLPLPFAIKCRDFQLDKYPGSNSPSSFASEVSIIDEERGYTREQRIFMNNVMDYRGYRFFQSSYDPDEGGTRLSVSHDWWGTNISYVGYLMMGIGMILSLFAANGRFRELNRKIKKSRAKREKMISIIVALIMITGVSAQEGHEGHNHAPGEGHDNEVEQVEDHTEHNHTSTEGHTTEQSAPIVRYMSKEHAEEFESLLVQDFQGRIIPMHTLADQLLRKISRSSTYEDKNAVQTIMSMHMYPQYWSEIPIIHVSRKSSLRKDLGMESNLISYRDLTNEEGEFKLSVEYAAAHQMLESKRGEYEKRLIKMVERYQVVQAIFSWSYMKILPLKGEPNNTWFIPMNMELMQQDSLSTSLALSYLTSVDEGAKNGSFGRATDYLNELKKFQKVAGASVIPSERQVSMEVSYNKMNVFKNSYRSYLMLGLMVLIVFFIKIFVAPTQKSEKRFKLISRILTSLIAVIFVYHGYGIYMRWYISGHAPWSNGYEAVIFIAWVSMLFGLIFSRKNAAIIAGTAILASLMIFVTEMNLMDPEITPLVPVLKSYWLMIHVAIITGSYGPLGIACVLGLLNLLLYTFRTKKNGKIITMNINELTYVTEMTMTIGVFMLAIGTFLGGIWANESWGRYWGWDPKETWALVAVLVYAVILHLRYIPGLKGKFLFNAVSFWGYTSILFTFFGVNFYLVGLHSYAQGEGLAKIPSALIWTVILFAIFTVIAGIRNHQYKKEKKKELEEL
ncbi:MAG: cytochrome c biogenesis protein CcsA [Crocinitomicaceae bacterium]|nr:cytochrome c biogenesis protein CcsA [Crocinitomicaceae bacterium]